MPAMHKIKLPLRTQVLQPRGANEPDVSIKDADGYHVAEVCFGVLQTDSEQAAADIVTAVNENERLRTALQRLSELTPSRANAATAHDFHLTVQAIADTALEAEHDRA